MNRGPIILGLDASTGASSVALVQGGHILSRCEPGERATTGGLLGLIDALLAEAGVARSALDALAVTRGPGGFTGVRIGVGVAQGIALGLERPVIALSTLQVLAETVVARQRADSPVAGVLAVLDARMGEVYAARYRCRQPADESPRDGARTRLEGEEALLTPAAVPALAPGWQAAGSGLAAHPPLAERLGGAPDVAAVPDIGAAMPLALALHAAGEGSDAAALQPVYLRDRVADQPKS